MKDFITRKKENQPPISKAISFSSKLFAAITRNLLLIAGAILIIITGSKIPELLQKPPDNLEIHGNKILSRDTIIKYLAIPKNQTWFNLDPYGLSLRLRQHPWVDQVLVRRLLPNSVTVHIKERIPIAYLRTKDDLFLVGKDRLILETLPSLKIWNLPVIVDLKIKNLKAGELVSESSLSKAFHLIELLKKNEVLPLASVSEIITTDPLNLKVITIPDGIRIKFGHTDFERKLFYLYHLLPQITRQRKNIQYLDLRYVGGIVMKKKN